MSLEEFALTWNNFTDNVISGFSALFVQGNLCDVTLAVEGKLLKAHKVVLSICSPYFQRMFAENPCQHPVIVLKDMNAKLVSNLLEFMYQGSVNVKQSELKAFMKIAENLQIKGLATNSKKSNGDIENNEDEKEKTNEVKSTKRSIENDENSSSAKSTKAMKMESEDEITDLTNDDDCEAQSNDDLLLTVPEITMVESRVNENNQKIRDEGLRIISHPQSLNLFSPFEYSPEALLIEAQNKSNDASINSNSGSNVTMLSSTSLLHGNCIFNRNNTVATQQGLKTYWLCKSYRISMCKARCITHQGKVISATGVHNHVPHMNNKQDIPPGHTPNVVQPSINEFNSNSMPSTSSSTLHNHTQQQLMMSQPYPYLQHNIHETEQLQRSLQISNVQSLENKLAFNSVADNGNYKIEHQI
ncbi:hypothetical protein PVAND_014114 [Polypedilum vanderplanki]|uniref:BTB domain-containing protein n=1 Tax=Polypedilum vanderplanki TaxID=319348 RepID=A0A9J6CSI0_POLVA|nr:hypothetical protein PVAND_014114 [Polypedilum vanderplanki]